MRWCLQSFLAAGADVLGVHCLYDPTISIKTMRLVKAGLEKEKLKPFLMMQPLGFHVPETENWKEGYHELPEYPYCKSLPCSFLLSFLSHTECTARRQFFLQKLMREL